MRLLPLVASFLVAALSGGVRADVKPTTPKPDAELVAIEQFCRDQFGGTTPEAKKRRVECHRRQTLSLNAWRELQAKGDVKAEFERMCARLSARKDAGRNWERFWSCYAMHTGLPASPAAK